MKNYALDELSNSCRGELAEVLANHVLYYTHRVKGNKGYLEREFPFVIPPVMIAFLKEHWTRIDLFKFHVDVDSMRCTQLELFEVKARKKTWIRPKNPVLQDTISREKPLISIAKRVR
ncbi:hypothetical protein D6774_04200 [Candidatus Woesearchaeota archaeon]|nr:MAG: hypothetical protein D6774_04200 [Candidatus Woesearchaeota archaeon]